MLDWLKRRPSKVHDQKEADPDAASRHGYVMSGTYRLLYKYLDNRYATTVVLTFAEIEALLGFALPDLARLHQEWWTNPEPRGTQPSYSHSWLQANRTARPNLLARTVVFERGS